MNKSIGEQLAALLGVSPYARGSWFVIDNQDLVFNSRKFSSKRGWHPVIMVGISGANAIVIPRSTTVKVGIPHGPHPMRHKSTCQIKLPAHVSRDCRMTLDISKLSSDRFSCYEPDESPLRTELKIS